MYRRDDPRLRRTLNQLSQNLESANESAQAGLYTFTQNYIDPCISSVGGCLNSCTGKCFPNRGERLRRNRARSRGRAELSFDFYDDWENDENDGLLGWGNDELDRLLAGAGGYGTTTQPGRERGMSYGIRRDGRAARRKSAVQPHDGGPDPTIIPSSSYFGFLGQLPWKLGGRGLRYKPSAADLREHPGVRRPNLEEEPLMEESADDHEDGLRSIRKQRRKRSETTGSGHTTDSLSSRGDIFPSEDEIDDAIPLDDEFATALERRTTGLDDSASGQTGTAKHGSRSRLSIRTVSSRSIHSGRRGRTNSATAPIEEVSVQTLGYFMQEDERIERDDEITIETKHNSTQKLVAKRELSVCAMSPGLDNNSVIPSNEPSTSFSEHPVTDGLQFYMATTHDSKHKETVPFPVFEPQAAYTNAHENPYLNEEETSKPPMVPKGVSEAVERNDEHWVAEFTQAKLPTINDQIT